MRRLALTLALVAIAGGAGGAGGAVAEWSVSYAPIGGGSGITSELRVTGTVTVDFHGDAAAGCAAAHVCNLAGRVRWNPAGSAELFVSAERFHGRRFESGFLAMGTGGGGEFPALTTSARVRRNAVTGSLCADARGQDDPEVDIPARRGSSIEVRMMPLPSQKDATSEFLRTRCAGPSTSDVARFLPARRVSESALKRGGRTLDFAADSPFSAHGFAGRVKSNVAVRILGREKLDNGSIGSLLTPLRAVRRRALDVSFRLEEVGGRIVTSVNGRRNPDVCGPLDACGVIGAVTLNPSASSGFATLDAIASTRHSNRDLRRALGLSPGPFRRGVQRFAGISWDHDRGHIVSELVRGHAPSCADSVAIVGGGEISVAFAGGHVHATYEGGGADPLRTRCPGPSVTDLSGVLASGTFPLSVFRHRRVTLRLRAGHGYSGPGYSGRTHPSLTVVLRRTHVHAYTFKEAVPDLFGHSRPF